MGPEGAPRTPPPSPPCWPLPLAQMGPDGHQGTPPASPLLDRPPCLDGLECCLRNPQPCITPLTPLTPSSRTPNPKRRRRKVRRKSTPRRPHARTRPNSSVAPSPARSSLPRPSPSPNPSPHMTALPCARGPRRSTRERLAWRRRTGPRRDHCHLCLPCFNISFRHSRCFTPLRGHPPLGGPWRRDGPPGSPRRVGHRPSPPPIRAEMGISLGT